MGGGGGGRGMQMRHRLVGGGWARCMSLTEGNHRPVLALAPTFSLAPRDKLHAHLAFRCP